MLNSIYLSVVFLLAVSQSQAATTLLCADGLDGSFVGKMDGKMEIRINLFCTDENRMLGTIAQIGAGKLNSFIINLGQAEVDGGDLIVAPFTPNQAEFRGKSSANSFNYLRVALSDLRNGSLKGTFVGQTGNGFHTIAATKSQSFPKILQSVSPSTFNPRGVYVANATPLGAVRLLFDVVHKVPIAVFSYGEAEAIHFTNGPAWNLSQNFVLNNLGGDCGEAASKKLFRLSGTFGSKGELDLSWISPREGLVGPFRASRVTEAAPSLE